MPTSTRRGRAPCSTSSGPTTEERSCSRYLDGLSVPEVAEQLGRTVHATEALLVRARAAFRRAYERRATMRD